MSNFVIKYEIEVILEAPIANMAWKKATEIFNNFDYSEFQGVKSFRKISTTEMETK